MTEPLDAAVRKAIARRDWHRRLHPFRGRAAATDLCAAQILAAAANRTATLREELAQARADLLELRAAPERERWLASIAGYRLGARLGGRFCHPADVEIIWKETP